MIKIIEEYSEHNKEELQRIIIKKDDKHDITLDNYPIVVTSKDFEYVQYEVQKKRGHTKNYSDNNNGILDKAKEKALEIKDSVIDTTRQSSSFSIEQSK